MLYISEKNHIVVDVTKAPYFADPTGKTDSTAAICRAIDDVVVRDIDQTRRQLPRIPLRCGETDGFLHAPKRLQCQYDELL